MRVVPPDGLVLALSAGMGAALELLVVPLPGWNVDIMMANWAYLGGTEIASGTLFLALLLAARALLLWIEGGRQ